MGGIDNVHYLGCGNSLMGVLEMLLLLLLLSRFSRVRRLATPWTVAYQAPPSMGFSRQGYWSGMPLPSPMKTLLTVYLKIFPTERLHFHFPLSCIGEGNGNPLQCSCLENPRDGGAWWAAIYGVTQSWTRLK